MTTTKTGPERVRLDKWLWAARFFKTRALSAEAIDKGRVNVNGQAAKASREPRVGDTIEFRQGNDLRAVIVRGLGFAVSVTNLFTFSTRKFNTRWAFPVDLTRVPNSCPNSTTSSRSAA